MEFFSTIKSGIIAAGIAVASLLGYVTAQAPTLGSTYVTPDVRAVFSTTLASRISSTDTSMTLTSATDRDGNVLASSTYGFIIDEGTAVEEFVLADCTGTICTNMTRGLSVYTGTSTVPSLRFEHRRGASVKITDAPSLLFAINVLKGRQNIENPLRYDNIATTTLALNENNLASVAYANSLSFGAVAQASETAAGFSELATGIQAASSTSSGETGARLVIPASLATSTYNSATAPLKVVMTQNNGKIDNNFIATSTLFGFPISQIASSTVKTYTATTTAHVANYTYLKPSNLKYIIVKVQGPGGNGGGRNRSSGGGGGGGYGEKIIPASALSTSTPIVVGVGGISTASSFGSFVTANAGSVGADGPHGAGGGGGSSSGGDINISGQNGQAGIEGASNRPSYGGSGGNAVLGFGGATVNAISDYAENNGQNGKNYGGGGSAGTTAMDGVPYSNIYGGRGGDGIIIVTEVYY